MGGSRAGGSEARAGDERPGADGERPAAGGRTGNRGPQSEGSSPDTESRRESDAESRRESGNRFEPQFNGDGLLPVFVTDAETGEALMQAWMNREAVERTLSGGEAVYYSRSRGRLWRKGETSGNVQKVRELLVDCDQDALWLRVEQIGGAACHTGFRSCFYRRAKRTEGGEVELQRRIEERVFDPDTIYGDSG